MKSTFQRNLLAGFGVSLLLLIVTSIASYISINNLLSSVTEVQRTDKIIKTIENTLSILKDAETGQRGFLLTGKEKFLEPYNGAYDNAISQLETVKRLTLDNATQQKACDDLQQVIMQRLKLLQALIDLKKQGVVVDLGELERGKFYMDEARRIVRSITEREEALLADRTGKLNQFAGNTPLLIVVAGLLSLLITVVFGIRINNDFIQRQLLQKELIEKDKEIAKRIHIIQGIAEDISAGNYETRVTDDGEDGLGALSVSLNKMGDSLLYSFNLLSDKEWLQAGIAKLNTEMIGDTEIESLSAKIIDFIAGYTRSMVGVIYMLEDDRLRMTNSFAFTGNNTHREFKIGEGLSGQAALSAKTISIEDAPESNIIISYATGQAKPKNIIALPIFYEEKVTGVIRISGFT